MKIKKILLTLSLVTSIYTMKAEDLKDQDDLVCNIYNISKSLTWDVPPKESDFSNQWFCQIGFRWALAQRALKAITETKTSWRKDTETKSPIFRWRICVKSKNEVCFDLYVDLLNKVFSSDKSFSKDRVLYVLPEKIEKLIKQYQPLFDNIESIDAALTQETIRSQTESGTSERGQSE